MPEMSMYYSDEKCKLCQLLRLADRGSYLAFEQNHFKCVDCLRHPPSMVHWPWSAICLVVRVRSSSEEEETQAEETQMEERREHTTENDFHYVMSATDIYKLLAD